MSHELSLSRRLLRFADPSSPSPRTDERTTKHVSAWSDLRARSATAPQMVWFYLPTCPPCKAFAPVWEAAAHDRRAAWHKIDASTDQGRLMADERNVRSFPTVLRISDGVETTLPPADRDHVLAFSLGELK